jgi:hypothetical protein
MATSNREHINNINETTDDIKNIYLNKGSDTNEFMFKLLNSISTKLENVNLKNGNIMQDMFNIAETVASEIKGSEPEDLQDLLKETMNIFENISHGDNKCTTSSSTYT